MSRSERSRVQQALAAYHPFWLEKALRVVLDAPRDSGLGDLEERFFALGDKDWICLPPDQAAVGPLPDLLRGCN